MRFLLRIASAIDWLNERVGRVTYWLVLAAVLVSAANALARYALNVSSNAWLELQWYLFAAIFLLGAGYTLKANGHVRIDVLSSRLTARAQAWIDILGTLLFLFPMAVLILYFSWPMFVDSFVTGERSGDAGGLIRWPAKALIPAGFLLLILQGVSELIKRIGIVLGATPGVPAAHSEPH